MQFQGQLCRIRHEHASGIVSARKESSPLVNIPSTPRKASGKDSNQTRYVISPGSQLGKTR